MQVVKVISIIALFILYIILAVPFYSGDVKNHLVWANSLLSQGPFGFYGREFPGFAFPNYPPVTMLMFAVSLKIYQLLNQLVWFLNVNLSIFPSNLVYFFQSENTQIAFLKLPAIVSNFGIAILTMLIYPWASKKTLLIYLQFALFIFNPASFYLSVVWGQVDLLPVMFFLLALYLLKTKIYWSVFFIALGLLSKQTIVIFLPIFLILVLKEYKWKVLLKSLLLMIVIFYASYLPFHQPSLTWAPNLYKTNFTLVAHSVNENALNLWGLLFDFNRVSDQQYFYFLSYQYWGYLMMLILLVYPTLIFLKNIGSSRKMFEYFLLITLVYFFVLTRMHERYLAPAILFFSIMAFTDRRYILGLIFVSFLNFLNLYKGLLQPGMPILNDLVSSLLFLKTLVVIYAIVIFYYLYIFISKKYND